MPLGVTTKMNKTVSSAGAKFVDDWENEMPSANFDDRPLRQNMTTVSIYMDDGRVFDYNVRSPFKGREHASKIVRYGYRHTPKGSDDLEWYPPYRIDKVKVSGGAESTQYRDVVRAT